MSLRAVELQPPPASLPFALLNNNKASLLARHSLFLFIPSASYNSLTYTAHAHLLALRTPLLYNGSYSHAKGYSHSQTAVRALNLYSTQQQYTSAYRSQNKRKHLSHASCSKPTQELFKPSARVCRPLQHCFPPIIPHTSSSCASSSNSHAGIGIPNFANITASIPIANSNSIADEYAHPYEDDLNTDWGRKKAVSTRDSAKFHKAVSR